MIKEHIFGLNTFFKFKKLKETRLKVYQSNKSLLLVGSGKSALEYKNHDLRNTHILTVNNSIKAFGDMIVDYYVCATDFPQKEIPSKSKFKKRISKYEYRYQTLAFAKYKKFPFRPLIGKTIFLDCLNWAFTKGYKKIYLLGFDHDYNPNRVKKWDGKYITNKEKLEKVFNGKNDEPDTFYGHGTPDPLRLGEGNLQNYFYLIESHAKFYGSEILNLSMEKRGLSTFKKVKKIN
tara:strand:+ start:463 stop:1164 length:702 start_codon:yes stop_codon:yes gene_type:complete